MVFFTPRGNLLTVRDMAKRIDSDTFRGIRPIIQYQRIAERYQPVDERPQQAADDNSSSQKRPARRFIAMRELIDSLKEEHKIERIDSISAEQEIKTLGLLTIKKNLPPLLSDLSLSNNAVEKIIRLVEEQTPLLQLKNNLSTAQLDRSLYSDIGQGLQVLNLELRDITLPMIDFSCVALVERCQNGPNSSTLGNLYLTINSLDKINAHTSRQQSFRLTLSIPSGVIELDKEGRRALLYQRADKSFALYADKQINLEI